MTAAAIGNVALAKRAYSHLEKPAAERTRDDLRPMFDLFADDIEFKVSCAESTPVYGGVFRGKQTVIDFFTVGDPDVLEDLELDDPEFIGTGDTVVLLGSQSYTVKKTGVRHQGKECAVVLKFRDEKIVSILSIEDMSDWNAAYRDTP